MMPLPVGRRLLCRCGRRRWAMTSQRFTSAWTVCVKRLEAASRCWLSASVTQTRPDWFSWAKFLNCSDWIVSVVRQHTRTPARTHTHKNNTTSQLHSSKHAKNLAGTQLRQTGQTDSWRNTNRTRRFSQRAESFIRQPITHSAAGSCQAALLKSGTKKNKHLKWVEYGAFKTRKSICIESVKWAFLLVLMSRVCSRLLFRMSQSYRKHSQLVWNCSADRLAFLPSAPITVRYRL